jgi:spore coat protein CotH
MLLGLTAIFLCFFIFKPDILNLTESSNVNDEYVSKLFDDSYVHEINIIIDDDSWNDLLKNAIKEEYYKCDIEIDGELISNVGIRAKGNTSLTQIASDSTTNRYSFKVKFDKYDDNKLYYGLDKLALNNTMSDTTYMKDYFTYDMMRYMNVAAPYSSFMNIKVNGEDWGLYLGVECISKSFLKRNYGNDYGELYKPETSMGGAGGKMGEKPEFDKNQMNGEQFNFNGEATQGDFGGNFDEKAPDENFGGDFGEKAPESNFEEDFGGEESEEPVDAVTGASEAVDSVSSSTVNKMDGGNRGGHGGPGGGMDSNSNGADLVYTDDDFDSYSTIFEAAKTNVSDSDKTRLIKSIKSLNEGDLESSLDIDATLRYFVVHNFVDNYDSYTGNMLHNYYLYEKDGKMTMLPWDYNLAFGGFSGGGGSSGEGTDTATQMVNMSIDEPLQGSSNDARPFWGKLIENEECKEKYHSLFKEFIYDYFLSGYFKDKLTYMSNLIRPYVENDKSAFYTIDEFDTGVATLKEFCSKRAKSIANQLNGDDTRLDASSLNLNDLGTQMGGHDDKQGFGGKGFGGQGFGEQDSGEQDFDGRQENVEYKTD